MVDKSELFNSMDAFQLPLLAPSAEARYGPVSEPLHSTDLPNNSLDESRAALELPFLTGHFLTAAAMGRKSLPWFGMISALALRIPTMRPK